MKKRFLAIISILLISLSAGFVYMTQFHSSTGLDRKEEKIIKHGFRLLEEQIGSYIKENYSGISKIEFSPIFIQGGKDNPPFVADIVPVVYDEEGNRAVLGGQFGKTGYPAYGLLTDLRLDFDHDERRNGKSPSFPGKNHKDTNNHCHNQPDTSEQGQRVGQGETFPAEHDQTIEDEETRQTDGQQGRHEHKETQPHQWGRETEDRQHLDAEQQGDGDPPGIGQPPWFLADTPPCHPPHDE